MGWNVSCAYFVYCVSRVLFRMSLAMDMRCAREPGYGRALCA